MSSDCVGLLVLAAAAGLVDETHPVRIHRAAGPPERGGGVRLGHLDPHCPGLGWRAPGDPQTLTLGAVLARHRDTAGRAGADWCRQCAGTLTAFGVPVRPGDQAALENMARGLHADARADGPLAWHRRLFECELAAAVPETEAVARLQREFLAGLPAQRAELRAGTRYRKEVLRACLNGLRNVRHGTTARGAAEAPPTTGPLDRALRGVFADDLARVDARHVVVPEDPETPQERDLYTRLVVPAIWVYVDRPAARELYGFGTDLDSTEPRLLRLPALAVRSSPVLPAPRWFVVDSAASRGEVAAAVRVTDPDGPADLAALLDLVRVASRPAPGETVPLTGS